MPYKVTAFPDVDQDRGLHDREFSPLLVRAELILGVYASMHGPSGELLGRGTAGPARSDVLGRPAAHH